MIVQGIQSGIVSGIGQRGAMPTFGLAGTPEAGTGDILPTWPSHQAGTVGVMLVQTANEAITTPSGWTQVTDSPQGSGTAGAAGSVRGALFWKRATGNRTPAVTVSDPGNHVYARILTFRGCRPAGVPYDDTAGDTASSSTSVSIPGGTTTVPNCLILATAFDATDTASARFTGAANAALTNVAERADAGTAQGVGGGAIAVTGGKAAAGTFGATTGTLGTASVQARIMVALKP